MVGRGTLAGVFVLLVLAVAALVGWLFLTLRRGFFWWADQRLPDERLPADLLAGIWPSVAVVIPALGGAGTDAERLPVSLPTLLAQEYPGPLRVILVYGSGTGGTGEIAHETVQGGAPDAALPGTGTPRTGRDAADRRARAGRLTITSCTEPPPGWSGRLWALRRGVELAEDAEFVLLTDPDVAYAPGSVRALVQAAVGHRLDLVAQVPRPRVHTGWERRVIPASGYFFAMRYPFRWANRPRSRFAVAAGGCLLVCRERLAAAGGLAKVRDIVADAYARAAAGPRAHVPGADAAAADAPAGVAEAVADAAVARLVKQAGGRVWVGLADHVDSMRPCPKPADLRDADLWGAVLRDVALWHVASGNVTAAGPGNGAARGARPWRVRLRGSPWMLAATLAGLTVLCCAPVLATVAGLFGGQPGLALLGLAGWAVMSGTYIPTLRYHRQPVYDAPLLPFVATLCLVMILGSARRHRAGQAAAWQGRRRGRSRPTAGSRAEPAAGPVAESAAEPAAESGDELAVGGQPAGDPRTAASADQLVDASAGSPGRAGSWLSGWMGRGLRPGSLPEQGVDPAAQGNRVIGQRRDEETRSGQGE